MELIGAALFYAQGAGGSIKDLAVGASGTFGLFGTSCDGHFFVRRTRHTFSITGTVEITVIVPSGIIAIGNSTIFTIHFATFTALTRAFLGLLFNVGIGL